MKSRHILFILFALRALLTITGCGNADICIDENLVRVENLDEYFGMEDVEDNEIVINDESDNVTIVACGY